MLTCVGGDLWFLHVENECTVCAWNFDNLQKPNALISLLPAFSKSKGNLMRRLLKAIFATASQSLVPRPAQRDPWGSGSRKTNVLPPLSSRMSHTQGTNSEPLTSLAKSPTLTPLTCGSHPSESPHGATCWGTRRHRFPGALASPYGPAAALEELGGD